MKFLFVFVLGEKNVRRKSEEGMDRVSYKSSVSHANSIGESWIGRDVA